MRYPRRYISMYEPTVWTPFFSEPLCKINWASRPFYWGDVVRQRPFKQRNGQVPEKRNMP